MGNVRLVDVSGIQTIINNVTTMNDNIQSYLGQYSSSLDALVSAGIIMGARQSSINAAFDMTSRNAQNVNDNAVKFVELANKVINVTTDLDSRQANELSSLLDTLPGFITK